MTITFKRKHTFFTNNTVFRTRGVLILAALTITIGAGLAGVLQQTSALSSQVTQIADQSDNDNQFVPVKFPLPAAAAHPSGEHAYTVTVRPGDTLGDILVSMGASAGESRDFVDALQKVYNVRNLRSGQQFHVVTEETGEDTAIRQLSINTAVNTAVTLARASDGQIRTDQKKLNFQRELFLARGSIDGSLYDAALQAGVPMAKLAEIINAYSYDVDFQRQIKKGDSFEIVMERFIGEDGKPSHFGDVLYASLTLNEQNHTLYQYATAGSNPEYYDENGNSVKKALLRTPVNAARITSGFGMRHHPVLGYSKMHRGVDFGAPTGTPIYAAGDGTVVFAGRKSGYGNFMKIQHTTTYATGYGHMCRLAEGMHPGMHVHQGQVIAYVGATGMATGPHLHFEVLVNNEQVNPMSVKFSSGTKLAGAELVNFNSRKQKIRQYITTVASAQAKSQVGEYRWRGGAVGITAQTATFSNCTQLPRDWRWAHRV